MARFTGGVEEACTRNCKGRLNGAGRKHYTSTQWYGAMNTTRHLHAHNSRSYRDLHRVFTGIGGDSPAGRRCEMRSWEQAEYLNIFPMK